MEPGGPASRARPGRPQPQDQAPDSPAPRPAPSPPAPRASLHPPTPQPGHHPPAPASRASPYRPRAARAPGAAAPEPGRSPGPSWGNLPARGGFWTLNPGGPDVRSGCDPREEPARGRASAPAAHLPRPRRRTGSGGRGFTRMGNISPTHLKICPIHYAKNLK